VRRGGPPGGASPARPDSPPPRARRIFSAQSRRPRRSSRRGGPRSTGRRAGTRRSATTRRSNRLPSSSRTSPDPSPRPRGAAGRDVRQDLLLLDGVASAVGRRGAHAREARIPFRWDGAPDVEALARRLGDAATLPLSDRPAPFPSGQWLLDPSVGAALLAAAAELFLAERPPRWLVRGRFGPTGLSVVDDASQDAFADGEGVPTRRVALAEDGMLIGRLLDLTAAAACGRRSTGHGVRPSFRVPPRAGPRRLFFEAARTVPPGDLLASVSKGLFASALTAPARVDLGADRYELEFTGVSIVAGRAGGPVAGARAHGRLSELLRRIRGISTDLQFFPSPYPAGSPTLLIERANFD
jgi:predicted Zn-dependent protease